MNDSRLDLALRATRPSLPRVATAVTMRSDSHFFADRHGNLATGGIFVATDRELDVGDELLVEIALHSYVLLVRGRVRWRSAGGHGSPRGLGVRFEGLTAAARWVIESFCARRRAAPVDDRSSLCDAPVDDRASVYD